MDSRKSSSDTSNNVSGRRGSRRGSIFDLMFLLRRGSSWKKETNVEAAQPGEQDPFLKRDDGDEESQHLTREEILEKIREKKECIEKLRCQPWSMHRKLRTLRLAQKCLERHESKVSKSQLFREEAGRHWKKFKRWVVNVSVYVIPWEAKIKQIESHFGSVVSSYFTFVRWIFLINLIMSVLTGIFIVLPGVWSDVFNKDNVPDPMESDNDTRIQSIWNFEGFLLRTPLFYNFYGKQDYVGAIGYQLPLAYFLTYVVVLAYCFFAILRKMAQNTRQSKLSAGKQEHYTFSWILFTSWDYTIGNPETAANTSAANANKLKETMTEYRAKEKEKFKWLLFLSRVLANIIILAMLCGSTWLVYYVVERSKLTKSTDDPLRQNEVPITVSLITLFFPNLFEIVGKLEKYHPRIALRLQLARVLLLYLLNFYTLIIALFYKMEDIEKLQNPNHTDPTAAAMVPLMKPIIRALRQVTLPDQNLSPSNSSNLTAGLIGAPLPLLALLQNFIEKVTKSPGVTDGTTTFPPATTSVTQMTPNSSSDGPFDTTYIPYVTNVRARIEPDTFGPLDPRPPIEIIPLLRNGTTERPTTVDTSTSRRTTLTSTSVYPLTTILTTTMRQSTIRPTSEGTVGSTPQTTLSSATATSSTRGTTKRPKPTRPRPKTTQKTTTMSATDSGNFSQVINATDDFNITQSQPIYGQTSALKQLEAKDFKHLCWETHMGQEICRLITMDFIMTVASVLVIDLFRGLVVRWCNSWWCWNLETNFPEYGEFKVAENVLHIVNNQGMIWLGLFFSPMLPAVNNIKLILLMYIRGWAVMTCNVPAEQVFRASRSNNFYLIILLLMLFLCTLPVIFVIAAQRPSNICGPFKPYDHFYEIITRKLKTADGKVYSALQYVVSPGIVIPFLLLLMLVIYFMICLTRGLRESNEDLKKQLMVERTEEKRKIYAMAEGKNHHDFLEPTMPDTKKVSKAHLPAKELRKLESWRDKIPLQRTTNMRERSDSNETSASSEDSQQPSPSRVWVKQEQPQLPSPSSRHFTPSLMCLPEESCSDAEGHSADEGRRMLDRTKSDGQIRNVQIPRLEGLEVLTRSSPNVSPSILKKRQPTTSSGSESETRTPHVVRDLIDSFKPASDEEPLLGRKYKFPGGTNDVYVSSGTEATEPIAPSSDRSEYANVMDTPASIVDSISPDELRRLLKPFERGRVEPIRSQPEIFATHSHLEPSEELLMEFSSPDNSGESDMEKFARLRSMVQQGEQRKPWRPEGVKSALFEPSVKAQPKQQRSQKHPEYSDPLKRIDTDKPPGRQTDLISEKKKSDKQPETVQLEIVEENIKPAKADAKDVVPVKSVASDIKSDEPPVKLKPSQIIGKPTAPHTLPFAMPSDSQSSAPYSLPKEWDISPDLQSSSKSEPDADESDHSEESSDETMSTSVVRVKPLDSSKPLATTFVAWPAPEEVKLKPVRVMEPISTEISSKPPPVPTVEEKETEEDTQANPTPLRRPRLKIKMSPSTSLANSPSPDRKPLIIKQTMVKSTSRSPMRKSTEVVETAKPPLKPESPAAVAKRPSLPGSLSASGSDSESATARTPAYRSRPESPARVRSRPPIPTGTQAKSSKVAKTEKSKRPEKESNV